MNLSKSRTALVALTCAAVGAAGGIVGSMAAPSKKSSARQSTTTTTTPGPGDDRGHREGFGPGRGAVHSEEVVLDKAGKKWITEVEDAGTVKSISGGTVTIAEGTTDVPYKDVDVDVSGATVVRNGAAAKVADLKPGDFIRVSASSDGTSVFAADPSWRPDFGRHGGPGRGPGGWKGGPHGPGDDR